MGQNSYDSSGQPAIVTGAARGIGLEAVRALVASEARVWMIDLDEEQVCAAAAEVGGVPFAADVADSADVNSAVEAAVAETGRIDVVSNSAGPLRDKVLWKLDDEDWDTVIDVSLGGTFRFTRACVPFFRERSYGRVVNVTSFTGLRGNVGQAAYAAAKAGVIGFTKTAAKELGRFGVTVNAMSPSAKTRMIESIPDEQFKALESQIPLGRFAEPAEIVDTVLFLASPGAGYNHRLDRQRRRRPGDLTASVLDLFRLDGKVAIVTGASSGLGATFAEGLAAAGADVALGGVAQIARRRRGNASSPPGDALWRWRRM
jgi:3-oxoacyl-[acyl-carrier protein] reductase